MTTIEGIFESKGYVLLDGGLATTLQLHGEELDELLWAAGPLLTNPSKITAAHKAFYDAGCDIAITSSYQMSYEGLQKKGCDKNTANSLMQLSTDIAKEAASMFSNKLVATSIGCYGAHLCDGSEYFARYGKSVSELREWHQSKLEMLHSSGADIIACETIPCIDEVKALSQVLSSISTSQSHCQAYISVACNSSLTLNSGELIEDSLRAIFDPSLYDTPSKSLLSHIGMGVNCTSPNYIEDITHSFRDFSQNIIVVYPNKGESWDNANRCFIAGSATSDEEYAEMAVKWLEAGANVIGGCCRVTPATIAVVDEKLSEYVCSKFSRC